MIRPTRDVKVATRRLAEHLGYTLTLEGRKWAVTRPPHTEPLKVGAPARVLAHMASVACLRPSHGGQGLSLSDMRSLIRWTGPVPSRGLKGWEEDVISALQEPWS